MNFLNVLTNVCIAPNANECRAIHLYSRRDARPQYCCQCYSCWRLLLGGMMLWRNAYGNYHGNCRLKVTPVETKLIMFSSRHRRWRHQETSLRSEVPMSASKCMAPTTVADETHSTLYATAQDWCSNQYHFRLVGMHSLSNSQFYSSFSSIKSQKHLLTMRYL